ncbi:hypothetical protein BD410DRAFT_393582 [Rickenella mellea]|uniref:F-box domain-containing protein n=1 Tax=Rickenella mellea TaxID=50990 RepID=A0A4Y7PXW8_9AGAM|nr:hypothetical protein BD410DRAFT_393582 [Rickenella mellea]
MDTLASQIHSPDISEGHRKISTGIGHLFPELLAEVFLHCIRENALWPRPNVTDIPMVLCRVCRIWRLVALATPRLWTHLSLTFTAGRARSQDATALRIWAERSQSYPISFSIRYNDGEPGRVGDLIEEARIHRHRWEQVSGLMPCAVFCGLWGPTTVEPSQSMLRVIYINILSDVTRYGPFRRIHGYPNLTCLLWRPILLH